MLFTETDISYLILLFLFFVSLSYTHTKRHCMYVYKIVCILWSGLLQHSYLFIECKNIISEVLNFPIEAS